MSWEERSPLGCQIWVEPTDSQERVEMLVQRAEESGLGWLRAFLMWPWIEEKPEQWDFRVFDALFDSCARHSIKVKATLTANSGPWHIGTPSLLHSFTGFFNPQTWEKAERYIRQCVERYRDHLALGQWILWNEPGGGTDRSEEIRGLWQAFLSREYQGNIEKLNRRWRTGYAHFREIPFPEEIPLGGHRNQHWLSYAHDLEGYRFAMEWLAGEIRRVASVVRELDGETPTCVNPPALLNNQAVAGTDQQLLGSRVDVLGASYHPAWAFTFAPRELFPALMSTGVGKTAHHPAVRAVEVTEVQAGNTLNSSNKPCIAEPDEYARFCLAGLMAGAETVTGWLLNTRSQDFEAGDWGLLDDQDQLSPRCRMTLRLRQTLRLVSMEAGALRPAEPEVIIGCDKDSQLLEAVEGARCGEIPGRRENDGAHGQAMLSCALYQAGVNPVISRLEDLPAKGRGKLLFLTGLPAWSEENARRVVAFAQSGGRVVLDCVCGRKTPDAALYRPWPGILGEEAGVTMAGLESRPEGYRIRWNGANAETWPLTRAIPKFREGSSWRAWAQPRFALDDAPCVWERPFGEGSFVLVNAMLGESLLYAWQDSVSLKGVLAELTSPWRLPVHPTLFRDGGYTLADRSQKGTLWTVLAQPRAEREGRPLRLHAPAGRYRDFWSDTEILVPEEGEARLPAEEGIALLWQQA